MAKVKTILKLFSFLTFVQFVLAQRVTETPQILNKTSSNLSSMKIKELEMTNNWRIIDLSHNSIESVDFPDVLRKQIDLETLRLNFNLNFSGRGNQQIFYHKTLKNFECVMCGFTDVQSKYFAGLVSLERLELSANKINRINEDAFNSNENLKLVDLTGNQLKTVFHSLFVGLRKFEDLYLSMNPIELPKDKPFMKSDSLKRLKMDGCNMTLIYLQTFAEFQSLELLNLNQNLIEQLPVNSFKFNDNLKSLFIENNRLRFFPTVTMNNLPQLEELCIDNNTYTKSSDFVEFSKRYVEKNLRTDNCNNNIEYFIENLFSAPVEDFSEPPIANSTKKPQKFGKTFINEGISNFFIGSYITFIIILQAVIFVLLSLYLIKITKYEKLDGDVNYANTILNDDEIYKVYKSDE